MRLAFRTAGAALVTLVTLAVLVVGMLIGEFVTMLLDQPGQLICPDGGDEIWARPSAISYTPMILVGVGAVALGWLILRFVFRRFDVFRPSLSAWLLAGLSAGGVTLNWAVSDYLSYWHYPDHYRCGYSYGGLHLPSATGPALVGAFAVAFVAVFAASVVVNRRRLGEAT
jgi:hypothetical protein